MAFDIHHMQMVKSRDHEKVCSWFTLHVLFTLFQLIKYFYTFFILK